MSDNSQKEFLKSQNNFFSRMQNKDLIRVGDNKVVNFSVPETKEEQKRRGSFSIFRQYIQQKNWSLKHVELFGEYRKMNDSYPIINAALRLYAQEVCLSGDTKLRTPMGDLTIKDLYYNRGKSKDMFYVQSYFTQIRRTLWASASYIQFNGVKKVFKVTVERNIPEDVAEWDTVLEASFKCTDNHKIMLPDFSFKELKELKVGDEIFSLYKDIDPSCKCKVDCPHKSRIIAIEEAGEEEVFDLINVSNDSHFSIMLTDSLFVEVHNCTKDEEGNIVKIHTSDKNIKKALEEVYFKNLKLNSSSNLLVKEMLQFGNLWCYQNVRRGIGVTDYIYLPPDSVKIEMLSNSKNLDDYKYIWNGYGAGISFEPWEVVHFKNIEDLDTQPYGTSILRSVVDTWRRIILMREALIIYRITRAPQRYLYKLDTTGMKPEEALLFADEMKKRLNKKPMQNPQTGEIDYKYNPISIEDNIYMPTFEGDVGGVDILQGASNMNDIEDYKIIKDDLFAGLLIPKSYLTFEEDLCLRGNTKIRTNEGILSIKELAEMFPFKKKIYVLSCNKFGIVASGKVTWAGATKKVTSLYKIEVNGSSFVEATDNHPFLLSNMVYKRADELKVGDLLKGKLEKEYKVTAIEIIELEVPETVYDLTVEEYHNFCLENEIFVHNSNKAALAQEDMRFAGAVKQYQGQYIEGLVHTGLLHLRSLGFSKADLSNFELEMNTSSKLLKKLENETLQQQVDLAKSILDTGNGELTLMSYTQVMKTVMKMTDEEIAKSFQDQLIEKKLAWRFAKLKEDGFYEEPEQEKKLALMNKYGEDDVFKSLNLESITKPEQNETIKKILTEKTQNEIKQLLKPVKSQPSKKEIQRIVETKRTKLYSNYTKVEKELGL